MTTCNRRHGHPWLIMIITLVFLCMNGPSPVHAHANDSIENCEMLEILLSHFQKRISWRLKNALASRDKAHRDISAYLFVSQEALQDDSTTTPEGIDATLKQRLQQLNIKLVRQHRPVDGKICLEIYGHGQSILDLIRYFMMRETQKQISELATMGLGQPSRSALKAKTPEAKNMKQDVTAAPDPASAPDAAITTPASIDHVWQLSAHVQGLFNADDALRNFLSANASDSIAIEVTFSRDKPPAIKRGPIIPGSTRYKWWQRWLNQQYRDQPQQIMAYSKTIPSLEAAFGRKLRFLDEHEIEILKPDARDISSGTFKLRGPLVYIAMTLDQYSETTVASVQGLSSNH